MLRFISGMLLFASFAAHSATPVPFADPSLLTGTWYILAGSAELGGTSCYCTSLDFISQDGNNHRAKFSCRRGSIGRRPLVVPGNVKVLNASTNARLQLVFPLLGVSTVLVVDVDPQMRYSVVVAEKGNRTLVMSRTREVEPAVLQKALDVLKEQAPQSDVELVTQQGC